MGKYKDKYIRDLLVKFVRQTCTDEERQDLLRYFQEHPSYRDMPTVEEILHILDDKKSLDSHTSDRIYRHIIDKKPAHASVSQRRISWYKYVAAATILLLMVAGFFYQKDFFFPGNESSMHDNRLASKDQGLSEAITLELGNGQIEIINPDGSRSVRDEDGIIVGQQEKNRLVYTGEVSNGRVEYNTLRIPYSKRFEIMLSDGTVVHLNAGTSMKYPVRFPEGFDFREVEVSGEAYFEVAHKPDQPFVVRTGDMDVRVLGTKFNVSTYPEDERIDVVLVEGSVSLVTKDAHAENSHILEPGYKASFNKSDKSISSMAVPTSIYTSWIRGELVFRDMKFNDILLKLERKYNVVIRNSNAVLARERFNASFGDVPLKTVLNYFEAIYNIEISMENDIVLIE